MSDYSELLRMPHYRRVLSALHELEKPRNYLEIGVAKGKSLRLANPRSLCVGIDPDPRLDGEIDARYHLERTTSDEFFAGERVQELFAGTPIAMAFIDGLHLFEYALRDFTNIEQHSDEHTLVVVHDVLPIDALTASRERTTNVWTGDVWKLLLVLDDHRPDLAICVVNAPPSGLGLIRGLDASNTFLRDSYEALLSGYADLSFADWEDRQGELVPRLLESKQSVRWRKQMLRRIRLTAWLARARRPLHLSR